MKPKDCTSKWFALILYHINPVYSHVCLFGVLRPTQEFFTHIGTSLLSLKGFKFWPILGTHGHWAVRVLKLAYHTYCDMGHPLIMIISEDTWHSHLLPSVCTVELSLSVITTGLLRLRFEHSTFRLRGEHSNRLHCRSWEKGPPDFKFWYTFGLCS